MKNIHVSLFALLMLSLLPQSTLFSMEQTPHIEYVTETSRRVNGQLQILHFIDTYHDDGTVTNEAIWIPAPSQTMPTANYPGGS
ncbi:MAG TPA: hypothetical protein VHO47_01865 [Candidatus Babeliales bacterium]|nr:hypothetical protein [Candidatus Babeliales bacterium]